MIRVLIVNRRLGRAEETLIGKSSAFHRRFIVRSAATGLSLAPIQDVTNAT